ncbi:MAG: hypothetical protein IPJ26_01225 [Bacteroidetes bacterium]|jgi:hypothetical protein|nr:hypothetical protein [Bacteroidota bacterium]MBP6091820.1 hypothetical protein [Crocinitomicaceae bacterium]MBP6414216.1 hypothetical protein [Bacteroidia bacterium]
MKNKLQLMIMISLIITSHYANAQWGLSGNAGTTSSNFLGTTDSQSLRFKTNSTQRMTLDPSGRLGLGVNTPVYRFDVKSSSHARTVNANNSYTSISPTYGIYSTTLNSGGGGACGVYGNGAGTGSTNYGLFGSGALGATNYGVYGTATTTSTAPIGYGVSGISNGTGTTNYGIYGSASGGTTNWAGYFLQNTYTGGAVGIGTTTIADSKFSVQQTGTTIATTKFLNTSKGPNISWIHFGASGDWYLRSAANTGTIVLQDQNASAKVCIGGTQAATGYKLSVTGKIICEELKVLLTANWPDYVFENEYQLMSLNQLENYISDNKHLPGVPSATEMEEKGGMEVGEMQTLLVKKLEEANLYILQLNSRLEELEAKLK